VYGVRLGEVGVRLGVVGVWATPFPPWATPYPLGFLVLGFRVLAARRTFCFGPVPLCARGKNTLCVRGAAAAPSRANLSALSPCARSLPARGGCSSLPARGGCSSLPARGGCCVLPARARLLLPPSSLPVVAAPCSLPAVLAAAACSQFLVCSLRVVAAPCSLPAVLAAAAGKSYSLLTPPLLKMMFLIPSSPASPGFRLRNE
jgi:hypothetical protein